MNTRSIAWISMSFSVLAAFVLLMTSCNLGASPAESSGSLRAWIDQPATGYTLPLASYTLKAHARQTGGGVTEIHFMVNDTIIGSVATDAGPELTSASTPWNPSAEGLYRIQAIAFNSAGQKSYSEISLICISHDTKGTCSGAAEEGGTPAVSAEIDSTIKVGGAPNPVSIGANCNPANRIVNFEAYVPDTGGATDVLIHAYLVGTSGERWEFFVALSPGTSPGSYVGTYDLGTAYDGVLAGADGRIEFVLALLNASKQMFRISTPQTISVHYCGASAPVQGIVKVMGTPDVVFKGKCSPSTIDFVAETDIDPGLFDHVNLAYSWFNYDGSWMGTAEVWTRAEMTRDSAGAYRYHLDINTAPAAMNNGGTIKFKAVVVSTDNADVVSSEVATVVIKPCGAGVTPQPGITPYVCSNYSRQQKQCVAAGCYYWSDSTCNDNPEPAPATCDSYNRKSAQCKAAGCYYWSDKTCNDSPEPAPPSCDSYTKNPDGCKMAGCYYWSDNTCNDYAEPAPPSCDSYTTQKECQAAGCGWDDKAGACIP